MTQEEKHELWFYSLCNDTCSCRDEKEDTVKIGKNFRKYYSELVKGRNGAEILTEMGIMRMCCRGKYLLLAVEPMIDRSTDRYMNLTTKTLEKLDTRDLVPGVPPPNFPSLV